MTVIDKTKNFLRAKPTRIIIALSIIAAIMVGVSLGIMALATALKKTNACPNSTDIKYSEYNNICGPNCEKLGQNVCPVNDTKNKLSYLKCVPKCTDSDTEYDPATCKCKPNCDSLGDPLHKNSYYGKLKYGQKSSNEWQCVQECPNLDSFACPVGSYCYKTGDTYTCNSKEPTYCPSDSLNVCEINEICINNSCQEHKCSGDEVTYIDDTNSCKILNKNYKEVIYSSLEETNNIRVSICEDETGNIFGLNGGKYCKKQHNFYKKNKIIGTACSDTSKVGLNIDIQCPQKQNDASTCINSEKLCPNGWQLIDTDSIYSCDEANNIKTKFGKETDTQIELDINKSGICCKKNQSIDGICCSGILDNNSSTPTCYLGPFNTANISLDFSVYKEIFTKAKIPFPKSPSENKYTVSDAESLTKAFYDIKSDATHKDNPDYNCFGNSGSENEAKFIITNQDTTTGEGELFLGCGKYGNGNMVLAEKVSGGEQFYKCAKKDTTKPYTLSGTSWDKTFNYNTDNNSNILGCKLQSDPTGPYYWYNNIPTDQYISKYTINLKEVVTPTSNDPYLCYNLINTPNNNITNISTATDIKTSRPGSNLVDCTIDFNCNKQLISGASINRNDVNYGLDVPYNWNKMHPEYYTSTSTDLKNSAFPISSKLNNRPNDLAQNITPNDITNTIKQPTPYTNRELFIKPTADSCYWEPNKSTHPYGLQNGLIADTTGGYISFDGTSRCGKNISTVEDAISSTCYWDNEKKNPINTDFKIS